MTQRLDSIAHHLISRSAVPAEGGVVNGLPLPSILALGREIVRFGSIAASLDRARRPEAESAPTQAHAVQSFPRLVVLQERSAS